MTDTNTANNELLYFCPATNIEGNIEVPGDKSISHRSLMLASQAIGLCQITGLLESDDVLNTMKAMRQLGVSINKVNDSWIVNCKGPGSLQQPNDIIDLGNSGTSARLLMGLVAAYPFTCFFTGDSSLRKRPMARVITPLQQMGVNFAVSSGNFLPCAVIGGNTVPITYEMPIASAQVKSAILLAGLNTAGNTTVIEPLPSRDHTENMLNFFGYDCLVEQYNSGRKITISGQQLPPRADRDITIAGDPSSAAFPIIAAIISPKAHLTINNVCINPLRTGLFTSLLEMGAKLDIRNKRKSGGEEIADITVSNSELNAITIPAERVPTMIDEYPILAMAAAVAKGTTVMQGLAELRVKESNRLEKIASGLQQCGIKAIIEGDDLIITGQPKGVPGNAIIDSAMDHRIAMSFLILGLRSTQPVKVSNSGIISTSFPNFRELMASIGVNIVNISHDQQPCGAINASTIANINTADDSTPLIIAIDGPAASGKGTLARRLADELDLIYLDTGTLYRAVGLKLIYNNQDPNDRKAAVKAAREIKMHDLSNPRLRQEKVGRAASIVSAIPKVREILLEFQRKIAHNPKGAVLDGRDIGTVVCPEATLKLFLTADITARAERRHRELQGQGITVLYESVLQDLQERDERDSKRDTAPLKPAEDAVIIDTSNLSADAVLAKVMQYIDRILSADNKKTGS